MPVNDLVRGVGDLTHVTTFVLSCHGVLAFSTLMLLCDMASVELPAYILASGHGKTATAYYSLTRRCLSFVLLRSDPLFGDADVQ